eukprot:SAG22_NODE_6295_length_873_cov_1.449612_2_plen_84_part_00
MDVHQILFISTANLDCLCPGVRTLTQCARDTTTADDYTACELDATAEQPDGAHTALEVSVLNRVPVGLRLVLTFLRVCYRIQC